jgi:hypothetical protein
MEDLPRPGYRREFLKSPHHVGLALATVGLGFLTGHALPLLIGAGLYALGWIYLPDLPFFRRWVDRRHEAIAKARADAEYEAFQQRRAALIASLTTRNRDKYSEMIGVCRDIERANADAARPDTGADLRMRKLDELAWTYLRLLAFEQSLEQFLEAERKEDLGAAIKDADAEAAALEKEIEETRARKAQPADSRLRLLDSARDRATVLRKRTERIAQAKENLQLTSSEQQRLVQQVKLVRADAVASKNARNFSARIDATVEHLDETNRWLGEIEDFQDLVGDMPRTDVRVGLGDPRAEESVARFARRRKQKGEEI